MKTSIWFTILLALVWTCPSHAQQTTPADGLAALELWQAGTVVPAQCVERFGIERCFVQNEIDDRIFARMQGKSYKRECTVPRSELRYLKVLHRDADGRTVLGEMVCNRTVADDLLAIFSTLYQAGYPIGRMVLIDDYDADDERSMASNNTSAFNFRPVAGTRKLSGHSKGLAVDINPLYNPCVRTRDGIPHIEPAAGAPYADRTHEFPCKIDREDLCYREFTRRGFRWGGDWHTVKDYQHFEKPE